MRVRQWVAIIAVLVPGQAAVAEEWKHVLAPYLWAAAMDGTSGVSTPLGAVDADVDISFGDIWDNLELGGMLAYRGERGPWAIMFDGIYMDLETDHTESAGPVTIDATAAVRQVTLEVDAGYRFTPNLLGFAGLRYNDIDADLDVVTTGPGPGMTRTGGAGDHWVDPVIGAIYEAPLGERWSLALRGDIGGFGVGSDFAWQLLATVRWKITDSIWAVGGYRYFDTDYEDDSRTDPDYFKFDMAVSGPALGVAFAF